MRLAAITGLVIAYFITATAVAKDYKAGALTISDPWSRATPKGAQTAVGYMTISNNGPTPDRLIGGSVDAADRFQLHAMTMENGIAKMRDLGGIEIKPGQTMEFKPGGSHVMFVKLKHPLTIGEHINGTLVFEHAGKVQIEYSVEGIGDQRGPQEMGHMQH